MGKSSQPQDELKKIIITGSLVVVLIFVLISNVQKANKKKKMVKEAKSIAESVQPDKKFVPQLSGLYGRLSEEVKNIQVERDPFTKLKIAPATTPSQGLYLIGVAWDDDSPKAIINDKIVAIGSVIQGYRVVEIYKDKVILFDGNNSFELFLGL